MAQADGVDRGVKMNLQQKDSIAQFVEDINDSPGSGGDTNGGEGGGGGGGENSDTHNTQGISLTQTTTSSAINPTATSSISKNPGDIAVATSEVSSITDATKAAETAETSKNQSGGDGGIGTGAIVGIVIGVVGGLLLIGAVAFFLLRKRRQKKSVAGYDGADPANTYMVDKETQGRATDSPNSPYSDENQTRNVALEDVARDEPPLGGVPRTSTSLSQGRGGTSGAQTPQGVSSNVIHLVEEGMTADEIRRLEEEERELDDEIERAARR